MRFNFKIQVHYPLIRLWVYRVVYELNKRRLEPVSVETLKKHHGYIFTYFEEAKDEPMRVKFT